MQMNVKPIPTLDPRINEIRALTAQIVNRDILPNEKKLWAGWRDGATDEDRRTSRALRESIKEKVKKAGLWAPHLPPEYGGAGLALPRACVHERGAGLQHGSGGARSAWSRPTRATSRSCSSTAPRSRNRNGWCRSPRARWNPASR